MSSRNGLLCCAETEYSIRWVFELDTRLQGESSSFYLATNTRCSSLLSMLSEKVGEFRTQPHQQFSGHWNIHSPPAHVGVLSFGVGRCGDVPRHRCFCAELRCVRLTLQPSVRTKTSISSRRTHGRGLFKRKKVCIQCWSDESHATPSEPARKTFHSFAR